jgi:hypothetical protein
MKRTRIWLREHSLEVAFGLALVPLLFLLGLQYFWLTDLQRASIVARQAALHSVLEAIGDDLEQFYRDKSEHLLDLPAAPLVHGDRAAMADHWREASLTGVRRLFVVDYTRVPSGNFYLYDPAAHTLVSPAASEETVAIVLACMPWQSHMLGAQGAVPTDLLVSDRDPNQRIIANPIFDERATLIGVVGLIVDNSYFRQELAPAIISRNLPRFSSKRTARRS